MNKISARWISLILSFSIIVGSLVYIAAGFSAETEEKYTLSDSGTITENLDFSDIVSTDEDEMKETAEGSDTFVYTTVLQNNTNKDATDFGEVYFDIAAIPQTVTEGEKVVVIVSAENQTDTDISDISFDLGYDADILELEEATANLTAVEFAQSGSGSSAVVKTSYATDPAKEVDLVNHEETLFFTYTFKTKGVSSSPAEVEISVNDPYAALRADVTKPELTPSSAVKKEFECSEKEPQTVNVYDEKGNNTLSDLTVSIKVGNSASELFLTPEFDPETTAYIVTVPYNVSSFSTAYTAYDSRAEVSAPELRDATAATLKEGINSFDITVTAQDGSEKVYTLIVKKLALDTLADPKDTLTKTVSYDSAKGNKFDVNYTVNGTNTVLDDGKDYLISLDCSDATLESVMEILFTDGVAQIPVENPAPPTDGEEEVTPPVEEGEGEEEPPVDEGEGEVTPPVDEGEGEEEPPVDEGEGEGEGEEEPTPPSEPEIIYNEVPVSGLVDYLLANTADLENSSITIDFEKGSSKDRITVSLADPNARNILINEIKANFEGKRILAESASSNALQYLSTSFAKDNDRYLISLSPNNPEFEQTEGKYNGNDRVYTAVEIPFSKDDLNSARIGVSELEVDTAAAEFVFVIDFSNVITPVTSAGVEEWFNKGLVKSLFGYKENGSDLIGYVQQICDSLENDSTVKVTYIAIGLTPDLEEDEYGVKAVLSNYTEGVADNTEFSLDGGIYKSQTYILPQAEEQMLHGEGEQNNLEAYYNSVKKRAMAGTDEYYTQAVKATTSELSNQYNEAFDMAEAILADADNANLVVLSPLSGISSTGFGSIDSSINKTFVSGFGLTNKGDYQTVAYDLFEDMLHDDTIHTDEDVAALYDPAFNPMDNPLTFNLYDKVNTVYEFLDMTAGEQVFDAALADNSASPINPVIDGTILQNDHAFDVDYALPNLGEYELTFDYAVYRRKDVEPNSSDGEHYYPISETVNTFVKDEDTLVEDIPTAAATFEAARLDVKKTMEYFAEHDKAVPEKSTLDYVLTYVNTGSDTLTDVVMTDSQILGAKDVKIYLLPAGQLTPTAEDKPLTNVAFSGIDGKMGEATIPTLAPGERVYVKYTMIIPEMMHVSVASTTVTNVGGINKVISSYVIDNTATGTADEFTNPVSVNVKTEFKYDQNSGGTTPTTTTTTTTTKAPVTTYPTTAPTTAIQTNPSTGESDVGYIVAASLLFGALGVFGVTLYGMIVDYKIKKAKEGISAK